MIDTKGKRDDNLELENDNRRWKWKTKQNLKKKTEKRERETVLRGLLIRMAKLELADWYSIIKRPATVIFLAKIRKIGNKNEGYTFSKGKTSQYLNYVREER